MSCASGTRRPTQLLWAAAAAIARSGSWAGVTATWCSLRVSRSWFSSGAALITRAAKLHARGMRGILPSATRPSRLLGGRKSSLDSPSSRQSARTPSFASSHHAQRLRPATAVAGGALRRSLPTARTNSAVVSFLPEAGREGRGRTRMRSAPSAGEVQVRCKNLLQTARHHSSNARRSRQPAPKGRQASKPVGARPPSEAWKLHCQAQESLATTLGPVQQELWQALDQIPAPSPSPCSRTVRQQAVPSGCRCAPAPTLCPYANRLACSRAAHSPTCSSQWWLRSPLTTAK